MSVNKITDGELQGIGVIGLEDAPGLSRADMQAKFEETARAVIIPRLNNLIAEFNQLLGDVKALAVGSGNVLASQVEAWDAKAESCVRTEAELATALTAEDNSYTVYTGQNTELTVTCTTGNLYGSIVRVTFMEGGSISFSGSAHIIGDDYTQAAAGETWEFSILDGSVICCRLTAE